MYLAWPGSMQGTTNNIVHVCWCLCYVRCHGHIQLLSTTKNTSMPATMSPVSIAVTYTCLKGSAGFLNDKGCNWHNLINLKIFCFIKLLGWISWIANRLRNSTKFVRLYWDGVANVSWYYKIRMAGGGWYTHMTFETWTRYNSTLPERIFFRKFMFSSQNGIE